MDPIKLPDTPAWTALSAHFKTMRRVRMADLFTQDPTRAEHFSLEAGPIYLDYAKNRITTETMNQLLALARDAHMESATTALFSGASVNTSEQRAALHTALRGDPCKPIHVAGQDIQPRIQTELQRIERFADAVRGGELCGRSGKPFTDIVQLGIGGAHWGPLLVTEALQRRACPAPVRIHFVSHIGHDTHTDPLIDLLAKLDPETTLFVVASKSFATREILKNTEIARNWMDYNADPIANNAHFVAVTARPKDAAKLGIPEHQCFVLWDFVGGRYSLWSAMGLPIALAHGMDSFRALLHGAHAMDEHFRRAPLHANMPVILGLLGIWYINFFGRRSHAVIPYDHRLTHLPAYLQQLDMESNGKCHTREGHAVTWDTAPVIWGGVGTASQHAFFQLLHQGSHWIPLDLIAIMGDPSTTDPTLIANCLAQSAALMSGSQPAPSDPHNLHLQRPGNRPSNTLLLDGLTPTSLGALLSLYEHKIFVQGTIWGINSFDQWGVEFSKTLAKSLTQSIATGTTPKDLDSSTRRLLDRYHAARANHPAHTRGS